jgi:excisionase family DNA binding protein
LLTATQVRERLGISESKLSELIRTGEIRAMRLGTGPKKQYRITEEALAEFIERNTVRPAQT